MLRRPPFFFFFFFNDTATTEIYTLSLHDALPISLPLQAVQVDGRHPRAAARRRGRDRSEEHTSELQSPDHLVCRLLLEKKKKIYQSRCIRSRSSEVQASHCWSRNAIAPCSCAIVA